MATSADETRAPYHGLDAVWQKRWQYKAPVVADETMNAAQLELLTEYLQRIEATLDRVEMNLRAVIEAVERVAGQSVPGERGLGH